MKLPDDIRLPFFSYGIFKPDQLGFNRIEDLVENYTACHVGGNLKERDGVPLLVTHSHSIVKGALIYFFEGSEIDAYNRIIDIEPGKVYRWDTVMVGDISKKEPIKANALIGRQADKGSSDIEDLENWDWKNDPLFKQGIKEIESILRKNSSFDKEYKSLFRLQMAYTLLWTAIERYAGLKYHLGKKVNEKVFKIEDDKCFIVSLKKNVSGIRFIYDATNQEYKYTLDPDDPHKSIRYYYQVRSNAIHRGKVVKRDFDIIKSSLEELLAIFKDMLK